MSNKDIIVELLNSLGFGHLSSDFLSLGYNRLQDVVCIRKEDIDAIITNPHDKEKFRSGLYEGELIFQELLNTIQSHMQSLFLKNNLNGFFDISLMSCEVIENMNGG